MTFIASGFRNGTGLRPTIFLCAALFAALAAGPLFAEKAALPPVGSPAAVRMDLPSVSPPENGAVSPTGGRSPVGSTSSSQASPSSAVHARRPAGATTPAGASGTSAVLSQASRNTTGSAGTAVVSQPSGNPAPSSTSLGGGQPPDQIGYASWYGPKFHGRLTASGQVYDMNKLTAANKTLPFGTKVLVTNLENGESVEVTINDRGPFVAGRIIDLSRAAAEAIGLTDMGVAKVRLHIVKLGNGARVAQSGTPNAAPGASNSTQQNLVNHGPVVVQVGAFKDLGNAVRLKDFLAQNGFNPLYEKSGDFTRVVLVSVPQAQIASVRQRLKKIGINSILVRQQ